jgi:acetyltransferase
MSGSLQPWRMFCRPISTGIGEVAVRPIMPDDADRARLFIEGLSGTSRYFRFLQALRSLPPAMLERFVRADQVTQMVLVGVVCVNGHENIVGEVRYAMNPDGESADFAIAVADAWHRCGVGTSLFLMLERIAVTAGVTRFTGESSAVNSTFCNFAQAVGFRTWPDLSDRTCVRVEKRLGDRDGWIERLA